MTISQALAAATLALQKKSDPTAVLDAEILLAWAIKKTREYVFSRAESPLPPAVLRHYRRLVTRRAQGEPVAYLTKQKEFYGLYFFIDKNVLVPRPETELLVEAVISSSLELGVKNPTMADIGTGSGCIAVALAKYLPVAKIIASDASAKALAVAKKNAKRHQAKIQFYHGDLLKPLKNIEIDIMAANLPYGWRVWKNNSKMPQKSLKFEPPEALFTGEKGLSHYRRLFIQIAARGQKPQFIICEFDPRQTKAIKIMAEKYLPNYCQKIKKDLAGLNRILSLKLKP